MIHGLKPFSMASETRKFDLLDN